MAIQTQHVPAKLSEMVTRVVRDMLSDAEVIYVFDSRATGHAQQTSDIDVAVLPADPMESATRWELRYQLEEALGMDVDLVDLLAATTVMRWQVVTGGAVIYERDAMARHRFEIYAQTAYFDLNIERAAIVEDVMQRGSVYGG